MSQPELFPTPHGWQVARGYSQLVKGFSDRAFLDPEVAGRRDGERTGAVLVAAGSFDLVATT